MNEKLMAPIAEYLGVAICEAGGNERAVWQGAEYTLDGRFYVLKKKTGDGLELFVAPHEFVAKALIEQLSPEQRADCCNFVEALKALHAPLAFIQQQRQRLAQGRFVWDEASQHFVYREHEDSCDRFLANPPYDFGRKNQ